MAAPTFKTAKEVYDYNIGQGLNDSAANQAAVAFKPVVDPTRAAAASKAFSTSMADMGITSASDPRWAAANEALSKQATGLGMSISEYSQAMGDWNDGQIANAKTQAEKATQYNGGAGPNAEEIKNARTWATGKTGAEIAAKAREMGVTQDQLGTVFGYTGADAANVGYGTSGGLVSGAMGVTWDGTKFVQAASPAPSAVAPPVVPPVVPPVTPAVTPPPVAPMASAPAAAQATVTPWNVTRDQTVQGQVQDITQADSPLMQRARSRAQQQMNARGLIDSTMAITAGEDAVYNAALDIARPDAATYADSAKTNAGASNQNSQFNAGETNKFGLTTLGQQNDLAKMATNQGYTQSNMALGNTFDLQKLDAGTQADLKKMATSYGYDLTKMDKNQANDLVKMAQNNQFDLGKMATANGYSMDQANNLSKNQLVALATANGYDMEKLAKQHGYSLESMDKQQVMDLAKLDKSIAGQLQAASSGASAQITAASIQAAANRELRTMEIQHSALIAGSSAATSIFNNTQSKIASVIENKDLSGEAKLTAINYYQTNAKAGLNMVGAIAGDIDLGSFMDGLFL